MPTAAIYSRFSTDRQSETSVERLQRDLADRDALAERCEKLREALRRHAIVERYCHCCGQICQDGYEPEWHFKGCLAAPKDAP